MKRIPRINSQWRNLGLPDKTIKTALKLGYRNPTILQKSAIPHVLGNTNLCCVGPTGSGKTMAYLLPVLGMLRRMQRGFAILLPTRELGLQVLDAISSLDMDLRRNTVAALGGLGVQGQERVLRGDWKALVATPGRLQDHLNRNPVVLSKLRILVLDEYDKLLQLGFREQLASIVEKTPQQLQLLCFSATSLKEGSLPREQGWTNIDFGDEKKPYVQEQLWFILSDRLKKKLCLELVAKKEGATLVFTRNRAMAHHLNGYLRLQGLESKTLHGKMDRKSREQVFRDFMEGKIKLLVATDIAARGLDTLKVDLVLNFDLPISSDDYLHRRGRTGRLGRPGTCISFAGPDDYVPYLNLEKKFGDKIPEHYKYNQKKKWLLKAKARHQNETRKSSRIENIRKSQDLSQ